MPEIRFTLTEKLNKLVSKISDDLGVAKSDYIKSLGLETNILENVKQGMLSKRKTNGKIEYSQRQPPEIKIKEAEITELNTVLSEITKKRLGDRFQQDIKELNISFTYDCGNSAAFILRKFLEKAIFHALANNGKIDLVKNPEGSIFGLEAMINVCAKEKINGMPILLPKNAKELLGMKFLGDSAAHDYLADVELKDINHQLSFWTMAIKQLIVNLK